MSSPLNRACDITITGTIMAIMKRISRFLIITGFKLSGFDRFSITFKNSKLSNGKEKISPNSAEKKKRRTCLLILLFTHQPVKPASPN